MAGKQKVVMKISVKDEKSRSRALRTVVGAPGCLSASLEGADKSLVVVIGEGIDSVVLTKSLRKKLGVVELVTVGPIEEKKGGSDNKKPAPPKVEKKPEQPAFVWPAPGHLTCVQHVPQYYNPDPCCIL